METLDLLYEGKAKRLYKTDDPDLLLVRYKDDATAFNGEKKASLAGKGRLNNLISARLFDLLTEKGISHHFVRRVSDIEQLVRPVSIIPLEVVVRNTVAGSLSKRTGLPEGTEIKNTLVEFYYKSDELGDPLLNRGHIDMLEAASDRELSFIEAEALKINDVLKGYFAEIGIDLVDFKLEFGRLVDGTVVLADEISPDTCRLWDSETKEKFDKDVFRRDIGDLPDVYARLLNRMGETNE